ELINGIAEIVKSAIIADRKMFSSLERTNMSSIENLKQFIKNVCKIKARVVQADEKENDLRSILNYGHTIGHAIEASANFNVSHGESVILGMSAEGWIAKEMGLFKEYERQEELLRKIGTRTSKKLDFEKILAFAKLDKKNVQGTIRMSLPAQIGEMAKSKGDAYTIPVKKELLLSALHNLKLAN
ncbi:MAG: hypothetical protein JRN15_21320, partial [Nitrososphaerota archaeon]|nr:hypothetical protein [Nitrososphaerota archaeon]